MFLNTLIVETCTNITYVSACGFPKIFALKDLSGNYYCWSDDEYMENSVVQNACPNNSESTERHIFHVMTRDDDNGISSGKCAIMPKSEITKDRKYIKGDSKMEKGGQDADNDDFYFVAEDVGNGQIAIKNLKDDQYLGRAGRFIVTKGKNYCGTSCHFIFVEFSTSGNSIKTIFV